MEQFQPRTRSRRAAAVLITGIIGACYGYGQVSPSAYRVLGQIDLRHGGVNMVQGVELNNPFGIALDSRGGQVHVYISDTSNSRVLAWADVNAYQIGDPPSLVLGQPGPQFSNPLGIGAKGFNGPTGLAVDPANGNLYVADSGNNRVLRFPAPFSNQSRIEPDLLYGQPNFSTRTLSAASPSTLNQPRAVAFDSGGNLWVVDTGYNRIVRFAAGILNSSIPPSADVVVGQKDFFTGASNQGAAAVSANGLDTPLGLAFDPQGNLYVADTNNSRVLRFPGPFAPGTTNPAATAVWGQQNFASKGVPTQASNTTIPNPQGLWIDSSGSLYVADPRYNRVLVFPTTPAIGAAARSVLGQSDFTSTAANPGTTPLASLNGLSTPTDVKLDANGNVFVADSRNNRVVQFPNGSKSASRVWGQSDFTANGPNQIKAGSLDLPYKMAIDYSSAPYALYISDTVNNRVLGWKDSARFRNGDPADFVIGQANLRTAAANVDSPGSTTPSATSLASPAGLVVARDGTLYVADSGNNRVLRYPRPLNQNGRVTPDAVIGQADFVSSTSAAVNSSSLSIPTGVALGPTGNLFVADTGNNRVLEFAAGAGTLASAIRVYGQPGMTSSVKPSLASAQTLNAPQGVAVDLASNVYVADTGSNRIVIFPNSQNAPPAGASASFVAGQSSFSSSGTGVNGGLKSPTDVAVDSEGNIYVADNGNNRVLIYPSLVFLAVTGAAPSGVVGQQNAAGSAVNWNTPDGLPTPEGLFTPVGVYLDRQDTLYVGDAGNNRVAQFLKPANVVNAASFQASVPVGQGAIATMFSRAIAPDTTVVQATTWPTTLSNRQILINDSLPAPIYSLTPAQVSFQVPSNSPIGSDRIVMRTADTGELIAGGSVLVSAAVPGLFTISQSGAGQGAIVNQDGTVNSTTNPAAKGSVISLYGTGQGPVSPAVPDGTVAPGLPGALTVAVPTSDGAACVTNQPSMCVSIGSNTFGAVQFSGLAPGFIGLWQINVVIPANAATGNLQLRVLVNGTPSNTVTVAVR